MKMDKKKVIVIILFILSVIIFYNLDLTKNDSFTVKRIVDGDTIELENGIKIRLLGLNTPEKNRPYYFEAKDYLKRLILDKKVEIKSQGTDKYGRILGYVFLDKENVNELILGNGFANLYYYDKDEYFKDLSYAENFARENELGIWKKSQDSGCIKLLELDYFDKTEDDFETLKLENLCDKDISIKIKDDANHYYERILEKGIFIEKFKNIFNDAGDSIYIWDEEGKLILFYRYS
jgi:hypothetical protein